MGHASECGSIETAASGVSIGSRGSRSMAEARSLLLGSEAEAELICIPQRWKYRSSRGAFKLMLAPPSGSHAPYVQNELRRKSL